MVPYMMQTPVSARQVTDDLMATDDIIRRMRSSCRITKARITDTNSEYLIFLDIPPPRLLESVSLPFPALLTFRLRALSAVVVV